MEAYHLFSHEELIEALQKTQHELDTLRNYKRLTENVSDVVFTMDLSFNIVYISPVIQRLTGETVEEHKKKKLEEKHPKATLDHFRQLLVEELQNEMLPDTDKNRSRIVEAELYKADGNLIDVSIHISFLRDTHDKLQGFLGVIRDISDIKKTERQLQQTKQTYVDIFNTLTEAIYILDTDFTFIEVNKGAEKMYGYSREELVGKKPFDISAPGMNDGVAISTMLDETFKTGITKQFEFWGRRKNGEAFPKEVIVNKGKYFGNDVLIATSRDLTELKKTESQLIENINFKDGLIENSGSIIYAKNTEGAYLLVNNKWEEVTGMQRSNALGKNDHELFSEDIARQFVADDMIVFEKGITFESESFINNGPIKKIFLNVKFPLKDKNDLITGVCGITTDITERKQAEQRMTKLARCLLAFGNDRDQNINSLVALAGEVFEAACALYNKLEDGQLCSLGQWNTPPGFNPVDKPDGHICYDVIKQNNDQVKILNNLNQTPYLQSDPNVAAYQLLSYIGVPVKYQNQTIGSLCIVYQYNFKPSESDIDFFKLIGFAVSNEEEQKADELSLKESEERLQKLFKEIPSVAVQGLNKDGIVKYWNNASSRFYGYTAEEAIGRHICDLIIPDHLKMAVREEIAIMFQNQKPIAENEMELKRKDGSKIIVLTSHSFVEVSDKEAILYSLDQNITDRKIAELKVSESEETYRNLFQNAQVGLFRNHISDGKIVACNEQLAHMCGYDLIEDFTNEYKTSENYVDEGVRELMLLEIEKKGFVQNYEARFYRRDKSIFWISFSARVFKEKGWLEGVAVDITEQKNARIALVEREVNLQAIVENSMDSVWSINTNYEINIVNEVFAKSFYANFGTTLKKGVNILDALPEFLRPLWKGRYDRVFKNEHFSFVDEIQMPDRSIFIEVAMHPIVIEGVVTGASFYGRDITEKTTAEKQLKYQADLRKILVELSTDFINLPLNELETGLLKSLARIGDFVGADRAYIFEYDYKEKVGIYSKEWCGIGIEPFINVYPIIPFEEFMEQLEAHQRGEYVQIESTELLQPGPLQELLKSQDIKSLLTIPLNGSDQCLGFIGFDSVKQAKRFDSYELQLLEVYAQLIVNVNERLKNEQQLLNAKEKAVAADKLKTAFLQNMSHEIRTPMNGILGFVDLLKEPNLSHAEKNRYIGIVEKSGRRLLNTINDIIEISKIEAGEEKLRIADVNSEDILHYFKEFFAHQAHERNVKLILAQHLTSYEAIIETDKHKLEAIISNLLNNALKFTLKGQITFGNYLENDRLVFFVNDTGVGIPADRCEAIFERFVQADLNITRAHEGSGLGLSIVKAYVEMLNGHIWVESKVGEGSVFRFSIPYNLAKSKAQFPVKESVNSLSLPNICVLIAEDDDVSFMLFDKILQKENIQTIRAHNGNETIRILQENNSIDIVLLDLKMPVMNGYETATNIRKFNINIPIIAQTAYAMAGDREKALRAGCNEYIAKPMTKNELFKLMQRFVRL
ncbi:MAG: putative multi-sensor hybrid histidine kinase [Bacteroidetes bacterium]|nr:MAG: putative multi-sensor hybrid histidine kinase [Bacteroidota bacterium]